uniref:Localized to the inner membrane of the chloroplast n=1 Tax=Davidia involucrata TaxID=16924 RepID=A0A5B6YV23_DAVIN
MTALPNSFVSVRSPHTQLLSGSSLMQVDQCLSTSNLFISPTFQGKSKLLKYRRKLTVRAGGDGGRPSSASIFVGGFILGGIVVGTLGCVYAPQISKALAGADRKDLMRKLPKFIYDEEKALERTRKILTEKIAQLNSAIDDVSAQLHADDAPNGAAVHPDELEASI